MVRSLTVRLLPPSATAETRLLLAARGLRATSDGFVSIILPAYLLLLGFDALHVGLLATATLLGSALLTLAVGLTGVRRHTRAADRRLPAHGPDRPRLRCARRLLAAARHRFRRHAQSVLGRRQRLSAARACAARRRRRRPRSHRTLRP